MVRGRPSRLPRPILVAASLVLIGALALSLAGTLSRSVPLLPLALLVAVAVSAVSLHRGRRVRREATRLRERSRAVMDAAAALSSAASVDEVYSTAVWAARAVLTGRGVQARLLSVGPDGLTVRASSPEVAALGEPVGLSVQPQVLSPAIRADLGSGRPYLARGGGAVALGAALRFTVDPSTLVLTPLAVDGEPRAVLALACLEPPDGQELDQLASLAAQAGAALARIELLDALRRREASLWSLVRSGTGLITVVDDESRILSQAPAVARMLGYEPDELIGRRLTAIIHQDDTRRFMELFDRVSAGEIDPQAAAEWRLLHRDGSAVHVEVTAIDLRSDPSVGGIVLTSRDITERKLLEQQLLARAFHDPLTDLPNRALFMRRLEGSLSRPARRRYSLAVLFLDLDNFKVINDSLGHAVGDELLIVMADRLRDCLRAGDAIARLGGDEFGLLIENIVDDRPAVEVARRILSELREPVTLGGRDVYVTATIGIALGVAGREQPDDLLRNADVAMYEAKSRGKNSYVIFDESMETRAWERLALQTDLRQAIASGQLEIDYQPLITLKSGRVSEVEALLRWVHPERGRLLPREFIRLAEDSGQMVEIGRWVLEEASRQVWRWQALMPLGAPLTLGVNLSSRQLMHPEFGAELRRILARTGLPPECLKLEISESVASGDVEVTLETLREIKRLGIKVTIDDFGSGSTSLAVIKRLPVDALKLDPRVLDGAGQSAGDVAIARAVIAFARALNLSVTAAGIETADQLSRLLPLGIDQAQGYLFTRPLSADACEAFLAAYAARPLPLPPVDSLSGEPDGYLYANR